MKKIIIGIIGLMFYICFSYLIVYVITNFAIKDIDKTIEIEFNKQASELMRDEIIRQLKEKEGMTIEDYLIKQYFERLLEETK